MEYASMMFASAKLVTGESRMKYNSIKYGGVRFVGKAGGGAHSQIYRNQIRRFIWQKLT